MRIVYRIILILVLFATLLFVDIRPVILIPSTDSVKPGLYRRTPKDELRTGDYVLFITPRYRHLEVDIKERYMLKQVGALPGDEVCGSDKGILIINDRPIAKIKEKTSKGIKIENKISGCFNISAYHFLPISTYNSNSYDGRYFGEVTQDLIVGKVRPLFTWRGERKGGFKAKIRDR
jgi:conjugative transfer signal peptidase TraF